MTERTIVFLHGFASSARSSKVEYLEPRLASSSTARFLAVDFNPTPRDFEFMTVSGMIDRLRQFLVDRGLEPVSLIGSSLGALVALHYAHRYGVQRLLLLAPLLAYRSLSMVDGMLAQWSEQGTIQFEHYAFPHLLPLRYAFHVDGLRYAGRIAPPAPTLIVHGRADEKIPIDHSRDYAAAHADVVQLVEVDSDHRLNDQLPLIWEYVQSFLLSD